MNNSAHAPVFEFDYINDPAIHADVHKAYWKLKEEAPAVFWTPHHGGHWVVNTSDTAMEVLRHPETFSSKFLAIPPNPAQQTMIPESLDPPEHRAYRQLLRPFFEKTAIAPLAPRIEEWAEKLIGAVADKGECEFVDELGSRFPVSIFMEMFGFPLEKFDLFRSTVVEFFDSQVQEEKRKMLSMRVIGFLTELIAERRAEPREDLISQLVSIDFEGRKLNDEELISIGFLMFLAGLDTVVTALTFGMRHLATDKAMQAQMIADPDSIPACVDEMMRRYAFVSVPRYITQDTEVGGVAMSAGEFVLVPLSSVGWDEKQTECPAEVRTDRPACRHAAFGSGIHTCLGLHLARMEMITFYRVWAKRVGHFTLNTDQPLHFRGGPVQALEALNLSWEVKGAKA